MKYIKIYIILLNSIKFGGERTILLIETECDSKILDISWSDH